MQLFYFLEADIMVVTGGTSSLPIQDKILT